jgi:hypothetical protein
MKTRIVLLVLVLGIAALVVSCRPRPMTEQEKRELEQMQQEWAKQDAKEPSGQFDMIGIRTPGRMPDAMVMRDRATGTSYLCVPNCGIIKMDKKVEKIEVEK